MKNFRIHSMLKILFIVFCALFMLSACGMQDGMTPIPSADQRGENAEQLAAEHRQCWQAGMLRVFYTSISSQTVVIYDALTKENLMGLMMLAFSIWMAYKILSHVSTPAAESIGEFWTAVLQKAFLCLLCGILVSSKGQVLYALNSFIMPIYITILEFASEILQVLNNQNPDLSIPGIKVTAQDGSNTLCVPFDHSVAQNGCKITNAENIIFTENSGMPDAPLKMMECLVCSVSDRLSIGYSIAYYLLQMASLLSVLVGIILIAAFVIAQLCFALYLIDSIFRLNMILLILPILIMAYPFEQTRRWSITGFKIIINSSVIMLCLVVMVVMAILALENILLTGKQNGFDFALKSAYEDFGVVPMTLIFTAFLIVKVSGLAVSLAGRVTNEGGDARFQQKVAALVGTIGQFLLSALGGPLGRGINKALDKATERSAVLRTTRQKLGQMHDYANRLAGRVPPQNKSKTGEGEQQ